MGKILIFGELLEIRELMVQDFAAEGHMVVAIGNYALILTLLTDLNPDLVLLDLHLNKVNPWKVMQLVRKKFPGISVLPFTTYTNMGGDVRLVIAPRDGGENLSFQDFKEKINLFLSPPVHSKKEKPHGQRPYRPS
jgi:CheY-like chemotaxis protein